MCLKLLDLLLIGFQLLALRVECFLQIRLLLPFLTQKAEELLAAKAI